MTFKHEQTGGQAETIPPPKKRWRLLVTGKNPGAYNMALDEAMAEACRMGAVAPTLRFYGWDPPALSIGYFQEIRNSPWIDACRDHKLDLVRRPTGGKAVLHHRELTYSLVGRPDDTLFPSGVKGTYGVIARALLHGLTYLGLQGEIIENLPKIVPRPMRQASEEPAIAPESHSQKIQSRSNKTLPADCFSHPYGHEIAVQTKKLIGSAQRRWPDGFLQHGSILLGPDPLFETFFAVPESNHSYTTVQELLGSPISEEALIEALCRGISEKLHLHLEMGTIHPYEKDLAERLQREKYEAPEWTYRR